MEVKNYDNIPKEKFAFAKRDDFGHDKKLDTKPIGYFHDAFKRFCKNKGAVVGAIVIAILVLSAIFAPLFTPYDAADQDLLYLNIRPKNSWFANTNFWDGCDDVEAGYLPYIEDYAISVETGHNVIKNMQVQTIGNKEKGYLYKYRRDSYYDLGFGKYKLIQAKDYENIQKYQNETGRQVLYPLVFLDDRPKTANGTISEDANIWYKVDSKNRPILDKDNQLIPNYWITTDDENRENDGYNSLRIEGDDGFEINGQKCYYVYAEPMPGYTYEVRYEYYEYYRYYHSYVLKDGITEPSFLFGTTNEGKDIFACLFIGARFSFLFAIAVAVVNLFVGAMYGAVAGYYGGKIDLVMERITDILSAVPFMIVITLLKLNMESASIVLILFIAFFLTGWIGMAGTTRMQFYRYKNQEYVLAARTLGARDRRLMFKHIFPNALGTIVTGCALVIPGMIYSETSLSYLGIINLEGGNMTSVGTLIAAGQKALTTAPFAALFPSVFLALLMLSFNLFGNGLRDAFNPSLRGAEG